MLTKKLLVSALVVTFCFSLAGTALADSVAFDEAQIAAFEQAKTNKAAMTSTEKKEPKFDRNYAPAGIISDLDQTTAERDARLNAATATESKEFRSVRCYAPAGVISNLDQTTAKMDAKLGC